MAKVSRRSFLERAGVTLAAGSVPIAADSAGAWPAPITPTYADWVLVLEKKS